MFKITIWYNGMSFSKEYKCRTFEWGDNHTGILIFRDFKTPNTKVYFISIHSTDCIEIEDLGDSYETT